MQVTTYFLVWFKLVWLDISFMFTCRVMDGDWVSNAHHHPSPPRQEMFVPPHSRLVASFSFRFPLTLYRHRSLFKERNDREQKIIVS